MKIFNIIWVIIFVFFAALQYNDPDPYVWIPIYMYAAILCWLAFKGKYYPRAYLFGILVYAIYAIYLVFTKDGVIDWIEKHDAEGITKTMHAEKPWIEDAREFLGLMIVIVVLLIDFIYARKKLRKPV
jgi:phage-related holin